MSGDALAVGGRTERTYLRRLIRVLGAKGMVVLFSLPVAVLLSSDNVHPVVPAGLLVGGFGYALLVDSESLTEDIYPGSDVKIRKQKPITERIDVVGLAFLLLASGYFGLAFVGVGVGPAAALVAAVVVTAGVVYDYFVADADETELNVDVVGFAVAEVLVLYAVVTGTGWTEFAYSGTFGAISFLVYAGTVVAFAGHAAVTREVLVSRTDDEIHGVLIGLLADVLALDEGTDRRRMAAGLRSAVDCLDGVRLPTEVRDDEGYVPAVVSTRKPDETLFATDTEGILERAEEEGFTGYVVYGENVLTLRSGVLSKFYVDGEYGHDADGLDDSVTEAAFHGLDRSTLDDLDEVTPDDGEVVEADWEEAEEDEEEAEPETAETAETAVGEGEGNEKQIEGTKLEIGGDEIDVEEMFEKADEVLDELD